MTIKEFNEKVKGIRFDKEKFDLYKNEGQVGVAEKFKEGVREMVICAGRGWGKSIITAFLTALRFVELVGQYEAKEIGSVKIWIVAPTYELAEKVFLYTVQFLRRINPEIIRKVTDRPLRLEVDKYCWILTKSADSPQGLTGERLDLLVIDEAADIAKKIFTDRLYASMSSKSKVGQTILIGTPRGKNWFYDSYKMAEEQDAAFHFTSLEGVAVDQKRWDEAKKRLPNPEFQQNYEAIFLEEASRVFRGYERRLLPISPDGPPWMGEKPQGGRRYMVGIDMAMRRDFSVIVIFDTVTNNEVYLDRFQNIQYPLQVERFKNASMKYNRAPICLEAVGMELPLADDLVQSGCKVNMLQMQGTISKDFAKKGSKQKAIEKLMTDVENGNIHFMDIGVQNTEFDRFGCQLTPAGNIKYGAPEGYHDDIIMAVAKANWFLRSKTRKENIRAKQSILPRKRRFQYK